MSMPREITDELSGQKGQVKGNSIALDQWRGLALLFVLISHGFFFTGRVHGIGRVGVNLFFFISGILVFRSLDRVDAGGWAWAKGFWKRRLIRLYPAMFAYVLAIIPIVWLARPQEFDSFLKTIPSAIFYLVDYLPAPIWTGHLWSLSVEMQFYLLSPVLFLLWCSSRGLWICSGIMGVLMLLSLAQPFLSYQGRYQFQFAVWPMMFGFLAEASKGKLSRLSPRILRAGIWIGCVMLMASLLVMLGGIRTKGVVVALGSFAFIPCFFCYLTGFFFPGFMGRWMAWLGERTYSIYLWQQPLTIAAILPAAWHPLGALLSIAVGALQYRWCEWPFLSVKRKH